MRPEGRLFFVNAQDVSEQISALVAEHEPRVIALDMSRVPELEYSALQSSISPFATTRARSSCPRSGAAT